MNRKERLEKIAKSPISFSYLKRINIAAGILHLIQGVLMLSLGLLISWTRDIYTFYLNFDIISTSPFAFQVVPNPQVAFTLSYLGVFLASFPLISAFAHFLIALPKNNKYNMNLSKGMNPYRWYEYAFSSTVMIVLISTFVGVWDLWSLVMISVLNATMIMFGHLMEKINQHTEKTDWSSYLFGCISGATPWVVLYAYFIAALNSVNTQPPTFVYLALLIYFVLFNSFAINMVLQYKGIGKWKDYLYGERAYIILSFVAKTFLSWIVFIGIFSPF